jgi:ribose 5-phosphate isomerase B
MLYISSDHGGFELKEELKKFFTTMNIKFTDLGPATLTYDDDYPAYAITLAKKVSRKPTEKGILICRNGIGVCIAANKVKGVRAATISSLDVAGSSRTDDDTNVLCLGQDTMNVSQAENIVRTWLGTPFSKLARHKRRLEQIKKFEKTGRV